jgi:hypothetical protein
MRKDIIENVVQREIKSSHANTYGTYILFPEFFDDSYDFFYLTEHEKRIIIRISNEIIDFINENKINLNFELHKMTVDKFFVKFKLSRFFDNFDIRFEVIELIIRKEIKRIGLSDNISTLSSEFFDAYYSELDLSKNEKTIINDRINEIMNYIRENNIDIHSEFSQLNTKQFFEKYKIQRFFDHAILKSPVLV